ncbi:hypothetical protein R3P38DRAFT_3394433 [Favolaschia claudopus]|uniref:Integrase core domain-containing protein n=1 Tax=Favolaschia claudopus TaxID=2862362 RepID=A0AAW0BSF0_9AGAR
MPNVRGKNGYGRKEYPPDDVLKDSLLKYVKWGLKQNEKLSRLQEDHNLQIGIAKLNQIERRLEIPSVRRDSRTRPHEATVQAILDEVEQDVTQNNGPRFIKDKLKDKGIMVSRDAVHTTMLEHFPEGFNQRYPGRKKSTVVRQSLSAIGPYHEVSSDGHEKLAAGALKMGGLGLPVYVYKDKWTAYLLKMNVVPNCRTAGAIGHLFLDFLEENGIAPLQITTDKGSETGWQYAIQVAIRDAFAPDIDPGVYPAAAFLKSVHNTVIEAFWRWLHDKWGFNMWEHVLRGKNERIFVEEAPFHQDLFNWIFPPLVQAKLDEFRTYWNQHIIRLQPEKEMPSGHAPADALAHPGLFGGLHCGIQEVGPRDSHLLWVTPEFDGVATEIFAGLTFNTITLENSWEVFAEMAQVLEAM